MCANTSSSAESSRAGQRSLGNASYSSAADWCDVDADTRCPSSTRHSQPAANMRAGRGQASRRRKASTRHRPRCPPARQIDDSHVAPPATPNILCVPECSSHPAGAAQRVGALAGMTVILVARLAGSGDTALACPSALLAGKRPRCRRRRKTS
ncbi:hypothetical protein BDY17DRAFT_28972 [Neohortaea acidophila]|uniref:Uncharacterized protein n=1 Tax=Neohortaea acidophila TaxID=245834 RepID=A0A6A6PJ46_9PEZI|nr:uncharacterized protein BDY17DRAFT_28972 [Neohortaea acidophila]KAF2479945.1 hypothetical protein BDY17DRAFT_28972 [Neohortaea acidophila]